MRIVKFLMVLMCLFCVSKGHSINNKQIDLQYIQSVYDQPVVTKRNNIRLEYKDTRNLYGRIIGAYHYAVDSNKLAKVRKKMFVAVNTGDVTTADKLEEDMVELKYQLMTRDRPFENETLQKIIILLPLFLIIIFGPIVVFILYKMRNVFNKNVWEKAKKDIK